LPVGPDRQEANANNPLVLLSGPEEDSDEGSARIDGMSDVDGGDDGNYVGETIDAAYNVDDGEEDDASQANDNTNARQDDGGNNNEVDDGGDQENAGEDNNNYYLPLKQTESIKPNTDEFFSRNFPVVAAWVVVVAQDLVGLCSGEDHPSVTIHPARHHLDKLVLAPYCLLDKARINLKRQRRRYQTQERNGQPHFWCN
jgi:hypothetical protein